MKLYEHIIGEAGMIRYKKYVENYAKMKHDTFLDKISGDQKQEQINTVITKDLKRVRFVDFKNKTFGDFEGTWKSESNPITDYTQGDMDASFFHAIWCQKTQLDNPYIDFASQAMPFSFAYINDKGEHSGFSITHHEDFPNKWSVAIIKNTNKPPSERTVTLYCPEHFKTRGEEKETLDDAAIVTDVLSELESDSISQLLAKVINPDATINFAEIARLKGIITPAQDTDREQFKDSIYEVIRQDLIKNMEKNKNSAQYQEASKALEHIDTMKDHARLYFGSLSIDNLHVFNTALLGISSLLLVNNRFTYSNALGKLQTTLKPIEDYQPLLDQFHSSHENKELSTPQPSNMKMMKQFITNNPYFMSISNLKKLIDLGSSEYLDTFNHDLCTIIRNNCHTIIESHTDDIRQPYIKSVLAQVDKIVNKNAHSLSDKEGEILIQVLLNSVTTLNLKRNTTRETSFENLQVLEELSKQVAPLEKKSTLWKNLANCLESLCYVCAFALVVGLILSTCGGATPALLYAIPIIAAISVVSKAGVVLERRYNDNLAGALLDLQRVSSKTSHGGFFKKPKEKEETTDIKNEINEFQGNTQQT